MIIKPGIFLSIKCLLLTLVLLVSSKAALSQDEYYIPKALIIPVHTHKQELHLSLGKGGGYDANISYALSKHLAVFTTGTLNTGTLRRMSFSGDRYMIQKNDYAVKGGIGYFFTTDHKLMIILNPMQATEATRLTTISISPMKEEKAVMKQRRGSGMSFGSFRQHIR